MDRPTQSRKIFTLGLIVLAGINIFSGCVTQNNPSNITPTVDTDDDGLSDEQESIFGTDATDPDSDNDSIYDSFEIDNGTAIDTDGDGIINALDADDDGDSIATVDEHPDDNGDGIPSDAVDTDYDVTADYLDDDDDNDGITTATEEAYGVIFKNDVDNDSILNYQDLDSDNDNKTDRFEGTGDIDGDQIPNFIDSNDDDGPLGDLDRDGIINQEEGSTNPVPPDSDNDGIPDYLDPGSDSGSDEIPDEQARFLGSWHNTANTEEHWIFYSNWTQLYTILITDNPQEEPYTAELRFYYTFADNMFCQSILMGGETQPSCYPYEFSEQDTVLTLYNNEEVMVVLIKD